MSTDFAQRCKTATDCLPKARYRGHLERLHEDMLGEIERLTTENEALKAEMQEQCRIIGISGSREARLNAENEALRKDAERYRHFINQMCDETFDTWTTGYRMQQIAENIQAAMQKETP